MKLHYLLLLFVLCLSVPSYAVHTVEPEQELVSSKESSDMETKSTIGIGLGILSFLTILGLALGAQPIFLIGVTLGIVGAIWNTIFLVKAKRNRNKKAKIRSLVGLILSLIGAIVPLGLLIFAILSI